LFAADLQPQVTGIVEPFIDVNLGAPVAGVVTAKHFQEGAQVEAGAVILELDHRLEQLEVERRQIALEQKRDDYERTKALFGSTKGISKEEFEKKESEYKVAKVEFDMAVETVRRRQILAPAAGVITEIFLEVGEACNEYQPLVHLVNTRQCYLVANVEATQGGRLKQDQLVMMEIDLGGSKATVQGKVFFLSPVVDAASGLQKLKVLFENKDGKIRPGLTGVLLLENQA
jgi:RND family efflux transporter MFP subunit